MKHGISKHCILKTFHSCLSQWWPYRKIQDIETFLLQLQPKYRTLPRHSASVAVILLRRRQTRCVLSFINICILLICLSTDSLRSTKCTNMYLLWVEAFNILNIIPRYHNRSIFIIYKTAVSIIIQGLK